jgi:hypothetical protein
MTASMSRPPRCQVEIYGNSEHVTHTVTGFVLLGRARVLEPEFKVMTEANMSPNIVIARLEGVRVGYDMIDGYNAPPQMFERILESMDFYFKRSYARSENARLRHGEKIAPYGLTYVVSTAAGVFKKMAATESLQARLRKTVNHLLGRHRSLHVEAFENPPQRNKPPRTLFLTRVWDPQGERGEPAEWFVGTTLGAERQSLNDVRVGCIRALRDHYGSAFTGGLMPTSFARRRYPDCIARSVSTARHRFLRTMHDCDICVSTTGLHRSNPFKLAEYVAASKAIVSEPLHYGVPEFAEARNYVTFQSPEECVAQVQALIDEPERIDAMQAANQHYYRDRLRPDRAVQRTLESAGAVAPG